MGAAQQFFADPQSQQITYIGTMREFDNLVLMAMRLKVRDRRISEVETLFYRKGAGPQWSDAGVDGANARGAADSSWLVPVLPGVRATREQLTAIALTWMNELAHYDPKAVVPVSDDCVRYENGARVSGNPRILIGDGQFNLAALGCREQLQSGYFASILRGPSSPRGGGGSGHGHGGGVGEPGPGRQPGSAPRRWTYALESRLESALEHRSGAGVQDRIRRHPPHRHADAGRSVHMSPGWDEPGAP